MACGPFALFSIYYDVQQVDGVVTAYHVTNGTGSSGQDDSGMPWCKVTFEAPESAWYHVALNDGQVACLLAPVADFPEVLLEWGVTFE